jgi:hypothetical protein
MTTENILDRAAVQLDALASKVDHVKPASRADSPARSSPGTGVRADRLPGETARRPGPLNARPGLRGVCSPVSGRNLFSRSSSRCANSARA